MILSLVIGHLWDGLLAPYKIIVNCPPSTVN